MNINSTHIICQYRRTLTIFCFNKRVINLQFVVLADKNTLILVASIICFISNELSYVGKRKEIMEKRWVIFTWYQLVNFIISLHSTCYLL